MEEKRSLKKIIELILNLLESHLYRTEKNIDGPARWLSKERHFVAKPEKLSSIHCIHTVGEENRLLKVTPRHTRTYTCKS